LMTKLKLPKQLLMEKQKNLTLLKRRLQPVLKKKKLKQVIAQLMEKIIKLMKSLELSLKVN